MRWVCTAGRLLDSETTNILSRGVVRPTKGE
jgi:hypothetical protein